MRIDRKLNLIIPVEREGGTVYVHSTPISRDVFERYYLVISKTFAGIYAEGLTVTAGPRIAAMMLKSIAISMGVWDGPEGVQNGLLAEIRRLSNVVLPNDAGGWRTMPLHDALSQGFFDEDDASVVENAVAFFCVNSAMHKKADLAGVLRGLERLWDAQTTSSNSTEWAASLPTSTTAGSTGAKATPSSIAS